MTDKEKLVFESYNAMSRPAMHWGIPIMPMMGMVLGALFGFGVGAALISWVWGVIFAFPFLVALLALRLITSVDDRYFRRIRFALRRVRLNLTYGKQLLLTPFNPKWSHYYGRRYSQKRYAARGSSASDGVSRPRTHGDASR
ncbi:hypothetical protein D3C75_815310 [compost metagenome]|jgi:hypothetical protein